MARLQDDQFRIFVSHKHEDHDLAMTVKDALEGLVPGDDGGPRISCFVSGDDILAATDWNRKIKSEMARSHMLVLLFTNSNHNWDWCLYEAGLFAKFDATEVHAIVCLYEDDGMPPGPLGSVQGVPGNAEKVSRFLRDLCEETHELSDDWRKGPLVSSPLDQTALDEAANSIVDSFSQTLSGGASVYHPCHRVVLDFGPAADKTSAVPLEARVVVGEQHTTLYTLASLFGIANPRGTCTWGQLVGNLNADDEPWVKELDEVYVQALDRQLFTPIHSTLEAWDDTNRERLRYRPLLYAVRRGTYHHHPVGVTIVFDRVDG